MICYCIIFNPTGFNGSFITTIKPRHEEKLRLVVRTKKLQEFLIIKKQLEALISQIYSWNKTLDVSDSSPVHHQEFFTVHTAVVYVIQVC